MSVLQIVKGAIRRAPRDPVEWQAAGLAAMEAGDVDRAKDAFRRVLLMSPDGCERIVAAAQNLADFGHVHESEELCRLALDLAPDLVQPYVSLAKLLLASDDAREAEALAIIDQGLLVDSRSVDLHLLTATVHQRLGALVEAVAQLRRVLTLTEDHLEANRRLAQLLDQLGDGPGSVSCWRQVVVLTNGTDLEALTAFGIGLSGDGQHDEAIHVLSAVASQNKTIGAAYADLGMAFLAANRLDQATGAFMRALELDPRSAQAYCGVGLAYQKQCRWQDAVDAFTATQELAPELAAGPLNLGLTLEALGDREQARHALLRAAAIDPVDPEILRALERVLAATNAADHSTPTSRGTSRFGASISGDLKSFHLFDVLEFLRGQSKTGTLVVSSKRGAGQVRLVRGAVTTAYAPGVKRLGETLLEHGLVSRADLDSILIKRSREPADNTGERPSLGSLLLSEGLIDAERITPVAFEQILLALEELLRWPEGAFSFRPGDDQDIPVISFDLRHVMIELMRRIDEHNHRSPSQN